MLPVEKKTKPMTEQLTLAEAAVAYATGIADLQQPLILQQEGQPFAVIVSFAEYQRLSALAADEEERRRSGWLALENLLAELHRRPTAYTPAQIEAEISAAYAEVKKARDDRGRSG